MNYKEQIAVLPMTQIRLLKLLRCQYTEILSRNNRGTVSFSNPKTKPRIASAKALIEQIDLELDQVLDRFVE